MSLGSGIFLFIVGAILAFAVDFEVSGVNLELIGYILMGAGVIGVIIGLVLMTRKRQSSAVTSSVADPVSGEQVVTQKNVSTGI
jgi:hypothetical protein